ncbi:hypothetical protein MKW94_008121 [Papaver nudicaule]|uniref:Pectinesterase n=1 Tax=Papaver nudicaule TaxID=74823 RepID=A0AA42AW17_PAPNU|nr:hypothetical protein [Papaver nudicaule]
MEFSAAVSIDEICNGPVILPACILIVFCVLYLPSILCNTREIYKFQILKTMPSRFVKTHINMTPIYYRFCYIEGGDFICGNAAYILKCHLRSLSKGPGAITAQGRANVNTEYIFLGCSIARGHLCLHYMPDHVILPVGWSDSGDPTKQRQYNYYGGGANVTGRGDWSHVISDEEAETMIGGRKWLWPIPIRFH